MKFCISVMLACLLTTGAVQAAPTSTPSQGAGRSTPLVVGRMHAPKIEGKVDPAEWKGAGVIAALLDNATGKAPRVATRTYVGYDDKSLYIALVCEEPFMSKTVQKKFPGRDRELWENEAAEIWLNPTADKTSYVQFIADILGQKFDALGADPYGYNPDWETAAYKSDKYWSLEIAVPFTSMNVQVPKSGELWYALIGRDRQAVVERSASQPTFGAFDALSRFGAWVFGSLKPHLEQEAATLRLKASSWPAGMSTESAVWLSRLKAIEKNISGMDEQSIRAQYPKLEARLQEMRKEAASLNTRAMRIASGGKSFLITTAHPYQPFTDVPTVAGGRIGPIDLTLLQNEWKDMAFNVTNLSDEPITLRFTTRQGDESSDYGRLGLRGVDVLWQQAYAVASGDSSKVYDAVVPTPAGTVQVPAGLTSQVWLSIHSPKDASGTVEGRIVIQPIDGSAGDPIRLPIKVTTIPVSLTANNPIHSFTWDALSFSPDQYPELAKANYTDMRDHGINMTMISNARILPKPKANPDGTMAGSLDFTKLDRLLDASKGIMDQYYITMDVWEPEYIHSDFITLDWNDPAYGKVFKVWWRAVLGHLQSRGISYDRYVVNPVDECSDERFTRIAGWIKEVDPKVRLIIDSHGGDVLPKTHDPAAMSDVWMPHYTQFFDANYRPNIQMVRDSKVPLWVYYYSESGNEKKMDPTLRYLYRFWWAYKNGVTGVCYWAEQLYGDPWYRAKYSSSYDTSLSYPTETGVIPSRRWQAWRQGWQDYCLLTLVRDKFSVSGNKAGLEKLDGMVGDVLSEGIDPVKADALRQWAKTEITGTR